MNSFLYKLAKQLFEKHGKKISELSLVFPNKRAAIFFKRHLNEIIDSPIICPKIQTINELIEEQAKYRIEDKLGLLFRLFNIYKNLINKDENFDDFYHWGEMLLSDFNDIDNYYVNAGHIFSNISDLKDIEDKFEYLEKDQVEAIQLFWNSFRGTKYSEQQDSFIQLWSKLYDLYNMFKKNLAESGLAYHGMAMRDIADNLESRIDELPYCIFAGFNALTSCEKMIFSKLQEFGKAEFYWDYDNFYVQDKLHEAGLFLRENIRKYNTEAEYIDYNNILSGNKTFHNISCSTQIGQAKTTHNIIKNLITEKNAREDEIAVVLADEDLLIPCLNSIPNCVENINITMGYPAKNSPIAGFINLIFQLQRDVRIINENQEFYYKTVLDILNHPFIHKFSEEQEYILDLQKRLKTENIVYVPIQFFHKNEFLKKVFSIHSSCEDLSQYLLLILQEIYHKYDEDEEKEKIVEKVEKEYIYNLFISIKRVSGLIVDHNIEMEPNTFYQILEKMIKSVSISFEGEPLLGIQIMGMLETRLLDFKHIIMLSVNEGNLPKTSAAISYIPYNLRKGFGLPTLDFQDSIYAYYFYRMIQRSETINILNTEISDGLNSGEKSRFIYQLKYDNRFELREIKEDGSIGVNQKQALSVSKNKRILEKLASYTNKNSFSASALNVYLNCPMQFYYQYMLNLKEYDEISEVVDPRAFGEILHYVAELIYTPFMNKQVEKIDIENILKDSNYIRSLITNAFAKSYFKFDETEAVSINGQNLLIYEIIEKYIKKLLNIDKDSCPFIISGLELKSKMKVQIDENTSVNLQGIIDRVDIKDDKYRIIDYKTGQAKFEISSIEELFEFDGNNNKAGLQTLFYCELFLQYKNNVENINLVPNIYTTRKFYERSFESRLKIKQGPRKYDYIDNYSEVRDEFMDGFKELLREIYNPDIDFKQTEDDAKCGYCVYKDLCEK
ncbi:MAG: PD-(D/E)XK nuclease family protein [Marinifilaceae bacterium]|jgi:hypothetical protein|nr:PD-(D/E)XK nuclease family protein [Marinifilaceae bacterium]